MKRETKKILSGATVIVCALALLLTGTFAWQAITSAMNPFSNIKESSTWTGANLHDDFNATTGDKDVYVENTGAYPIYVRIKLEEILDTTTHLAPTTPAWKTHTPDGTVEDCDKGFHDAFTDAFKWTMGNTTARDYNSIVGTTKWNDAQEQGREELDKLVADAHGDTVLTYMASKVDTSASTTVTNGIPICEVISMEDYKTKSAADQKAFVGWVYDEDGYAYWSKQLLPGEATGLLLDAVSLPGDETYYYAINVIMEYVDILDLPAWLDDDVAITEGTNAGQTATEATDDAKELLRGISATDLSEYNKVGDTFSASGWDWVVIAVDGDNALVTTTTVIGTTQFNPDRSAPNANVYNGSTLDTALRNFYDGLEAYDETSKENRITEVAQPSDFAVKNPSNADRDTAAGLSKVVAADEGDKTCFALSWKEAREYLVTGSLTDGVHPDSSCDCAAGIPDHKKIPTGFGDNFKHHHDHGEYQVYWTRTAHRDDGKVNGVTPDHSIGGSFGEVDRTEYSARPALWISIK